MHKFRPKTGGGGLCLQLISAEGVSVLEIGDGMICPFGSNETRGSRRADCVSAANRIPGLNAVFSEMEIGGKQAESVVNYNKVSGIVENAAIKDNPVLRGDNIAAFGNIVIHNGIPIGFTG